MSDAPVDELDADLSDVLEEHMTEVIALLQRLAEDVEDGPGGLQELRRWFATLNRMCGISAEATRRLLAMLSHCVSAPRQPKKGEPSRDSLQNAFVRMGGTKTMVNVMLLRLNDPTVVAACARCLAAAVQGSPLAAEAMLLENQQVRLVLRAVERHQTHSDVAEQGCLLICHLCSQTPYGGSLDTNPARAKAHRDCQVLVAREGAVDLVVDILFAAVREGQVADPKGTRLKQGGRGGVGDKGDKQSWRRLAEIEVASARIQEVALQALVLMTYRNKETLRMLSGVLWVMAEQEDDAYARRESEYFSAPDGEARQRLGTLEAFAKSTMFFAKVLRSYIFQDRPNLAAKVCRLLVMLVDHQRSLCSQIEDSDRIHRGEDEVRKTAATGLKLPQNKGLPDPFLPIEPLVTALLYTLAAHSAEMPLVAEVLEVVFRMKEMSMMSVPAGVEAKGPDSRVHWQNFMAQCLEKNELRDTERRLKEVLHNTAMAEQRCAELGVRPDEISGDKGGVFLTPRMKARVETSLSQAIELASDAEIGAFVPHKPKLSKQVEVLNERSVRGRHGSQRSNTRRLTSGSSTGGGARAKTPPESRGSSRANSTTGKEGRKHTPAVSHLASTTSSNVADEEENGNPDDEFDINATRPNDWKSAVGFGDHDEADFKRRWKKPLMDALNRSFSMPTVNTMPPSGVASQALSTAPGATSTTSTVAFEAAVGLEGTTSDSLDQLLDVTYVSGGPGQLKARLVVPPEDKSSHTVAQLRLQQLRDPQNVSKMLTRELAKSLRRSGHLLPKYGVEVNVTKVRERDYTKAQLDQSRVIAPRSSSVAQSSTRLQRGAR